MPTFIPVFRGKTLDGRWLEGDLQREQEDTEIIYSICPFGGYFETVIPETIGMSTGKTDKNGKIIFGGDRVTYLDLDGEVCVRTIVWLDTGFAARGYGGSYGFDSQCEIIGNTTDNPL